MADLDSLLGEAASGGKTPTAASGVPDKALADPAVARGVKALSTETGDAGADILTCLDDFASGEGFETLIRRVTAVGNGLDGVSDLLRQMYVLIATKIAPALLAGEDAETPLRELITLCTKLTAALAALPGARAGSGAGKKSADKSNDDDTSTGGKDKDKSSGDKATKTEKSNDTGTSATRTGDTSQGAQSAQNPADLTTSLTSGVPSATTVTPMTTMTTPVSMTGIPSTGTPSTVLSGFNPLAFGGTTTAGQSVGTTPSVKASGGGVTMDELRQMVTDAKNKVAAEGGPSKTATTDTRPSTTTATRTTSDTPLRVTREGVTPVRTATPDPTVAAVPLVQGQTVQGSAVDPSQISGRSAQTTLTSAGTGTGTTTAAGARSPMGGGMMPPMGGMMNGAGAPKAGGTKDDIKSELLSDGPLLTGQAARDIGVKGGVLGNDLTPDDKPDNTTRKDEYLW